VSNPALVSAVIFAGAAAAGAGVAWRSERARRNALERDAAALRQSVEDERRAFEVKAESKRGRESELADLRQRLDKAKRRAFAAQEEKAPLEARVAALATELGDREREAKRLRDDVARLEGQLEDVGRDRAKLREDATRLAGERDKAARELRVDPEEHRGVVRRLEVAEEEVRRLGGQVRDVERDALRYRQRERTHRRLYMVIRGELDAARDRIRTLTGAPPGEAFSEPDAGDDTADGDV
jgi:chromosome segregation ATPase